MFLLVLLEVGALGECFVAQLAHMWLFSRVGQSVSLQLPGQSKRLVACTAHVRLLACVHDKLVLLETRGHVEGGVADLADEGF